MEVPARVLCIPHPHGRCSSKGRAQGTAQSLDAESQGRPLPACEAQSQLDHLQHNLGRQLLPPVPMGKLLPHRLTTAQGRAPGPRSASVQSRLFPKHALCSWELGLPPLAAFHVGT